MAAALAEAGVNRVSLGVQDFDAGVQAAINRNQTFAQTEAAVRALREAGIDKVSFDLMYGLPEQSTTSVAATVDEAISLGPDRISLFGYAHVPWLKRHQGQIDEAALADARGRLALYRVAEGRLTDAGFVSIGIDHFARAGDPLAVAAASRGLRRNFQGYTTDTVTTLIGLGASAIGTLPQGYVQNAANLTAYRAAVESGKLATARGLALNAEDRLRREVIGELMCMLFVDLEDVSRRHGADPACFAAAIATLRPMTADGLVRIDGWRISVAAEARPVLRAVCTAFDTYLATGKGRHSAAI
jgi:oxygen-independent coproporphyrinogen-3 oxidase